MSRFLKLEQYSLGVGDRFACQAQAQVRACQLALQDGIEVIPVWNKSNREHLIIGSDPADTRAAADAAVKALGWNRPHHVDADHIGSKTVDRFLSYADFYTLDVADWIGKPADAEVIARFVDRHPELVAPVEIPGLPSPLQSTAGQLHRISSKYLLAVQEAGKTYRHIAAAKGEASFITEVSMDETDTPQSPAELLVILAALADEGVPLQTIAPKFTGRFNKGVDYVGDLDHFEREFTDDVAVLEFAAKQYGLPPGLKLSVHSGSDKFSIYAPIRRALARFDAGLHLKTAGTTWLAELIGLAQTGGDGLQIAKEVYAGALAHARELCAPYASVIDINAGKLPPVESVQRWSSDQFVAALDHDPSDPAYNPHLRQLLHVGYKIAAHMGRRYLDAVRVHEHAISRQVTENLYQRHLRPLFLVPGS